MPSDQPRNRFALDYTAAGSIGVRNSGHIAAPSQVWCHRSFPVLFAAGGGAPIARQFGRVRWQCWCRMPSRCGADVGCRATQHAPAFAGRQQSVGCCSECTWRGAQTSCAPLLAAGRSQNSDFFSLLQPLVSKHKLPPSAKRRCAFPPLAHNHSSVARFRPVRNGCQRRLHALDGWVGHHAGSRVGFRASHRAP